SHFPDVQAGLMGTPTNAVKLAGLAVLLVVALLLSSAAPAAPESEVEPTDFASNPINLVNVSDDAYSVGISPDGSRLAVGSGNVNRPGRVEVWDLRTRKLQWSEELPRGIPSLAFSPDSKRL